MGIGYCPMLLAVVLHKSVLRCVLDLPAASFMAPFWGNCSTRRLEAEGCRQKTRSQEAIVSTESLCRY